MSSPTARKKGKARRGTVAQGNLASITKGIKEEPDGTASSGTTADAAAATNGSNDAILYSPKAAQAGKAHLVISKDTKHCIARFAGYSKKGKASYNPYKKNQDSMVLERDPATGAMCMCVFDGHGPVGEKVSQHFMRRVPQLAFALLSASPPATAAEALTGAILQTERELLAKKEIDSSFSGSTAVTSLIIGNHVTCANVGDSRLILGRVKEGAKTVEPASVEAVEVSIDHKPESPLEKARILAKGGRVFAEVFEDDDGEGPVRVWLAEMDIPGLAMSRSVGDTIAKEAGVISTPEIFEVDLTDRDVYMVLASDGLWEFISNEQVIGMVAKAEASGCNCDTVADQLVAEGNRMWELEDEDSIDDTTVIVAYFRALDKLRGVASPDGGSSSSSGNGVAAATVNGTGAGGGAGATAIATVSSAPASAGTASTASTAAPAQAASGGGGGGGAAAGAQSTVDVDGITLQFGGLGVGDGGGAATGDGDGDGDESASDSEGEIVAPNWKKYIDDETHKVYFFNTETETAIWEDPAKPGLEAAIALAERTKAGGGGGGAAAAGAGASKDGAGGAGGGENGAGGVTWEKHSDPATGRQYWFNTDTGESSWFDPTKKKAEGDNVWEEHVDPGSGRRYFFNPKRNKSVWTKPTEEGAIILSTTS